MKQGPNFARSFSIQSGIQKSKKFGTDTVSLAGALGLLSPQKDLTKGGVYKPSLFRNLQKGSVNEEYASIKNMPPMNFGISQEKHKNSIASLMADLRNASSHVTHANAAKKNIKTHLRSLTNEDELLALLKSSYADEELSPSLLMQFFLNRHLTDLSKLPFDVANPNLAVFEKNGWTHINFIELRILLLKKYHDLGQPLEIIKILKNSFHSEFLPVIKTQQISPFYERIVWKFYFEYIGLSEETRMIERLNSLRSSFLIWEAVTARSGEILGKIASQHELTRPQLLFLKAVSCPPVQDVIDAELEQGKSALLSGFKKLSWKFKIYKARPVQDVASRAFLLSLIHNLENIIAGHFANPDKNSELTSVLNELKEERLRMITPEPNEPAQEFTASYAH
ncbi:hypothetical protein OXX59_004862 [Metschnikowia pulcherrima]